MQGESTLCPFDLRPTCSLSHHGNGDLFYRVQLGKLEDFIKTACLTNLTFLGTDSEGNDNEEKVTRFFETINETKKSAGGLNEFKEQGTEISSEHRNSNPSAVKAGTMNGHQHNASHSRLKRLGAIMGIAKRSRSINYNDCPSKRAHQ